MAQRCTNLPAQSHDDPATAPLAPLTIIRTETVLSRLPIHNLAKKGRVQITITQKNAQGELELYWKVSPNAALGEPRQLAYKLDTLVINRRIDALGRPLPKILRLDSFTQLGTSLDMTASGRTNSMLRQAFHENAGAYIIAKLRYTATDGTERTLEAGFTRYSVVFTGERLPDGTKADAVYLVLNEPYWQVLNSAPTRPLDYDYLKALPPAAQRCYEIISYKLFAALKYGHAEARLLYSEYCTFAAQQRYAEASRVKKQMYKVHKPHLTSGYLASVRYEATTDAEGQPDWAMYYVPGPKACTEYAAFNGRNTARAARAPRREDQGEATAPGIPAADEAPPTPSPTADAALRTQAQALVQHFHRRFHGTPDVTPGARELTQACDVITQYGEDQARHLVEFSVTAAHETDYRPQTFGGILQYTARALADYADAQQRRAAEARAREDERRAQEAEHLRSQYEAYYAARLAELRAAAPPEVLAAVEQAAAAQFERDNTSRFGRERLRRLALDAAVAAQFQLPDFAAWQAAQHTPEGHGDATP